MIAISASLGTVAPSSARISLRTPSNGDGTSALTLSVMTSSRGSYLATWSPGCLSHFPIVPSATLSPSWGIVTLATFAVPPVCQAWPVVAPSVAHPDASGRVVQRRTPEAFPRRFSIRQNAHPRSRMAGTRTFRGLPPVRCRRFQRDDPTSWPIGARDPPHSGHSVPRMGISPGLRRVLAGSSDAVGACRGPYRGLSTRRASGCRRRSSRG